MDILCFGDSNTYGYDPRGYFGGRYDAANRWPELLKTNLGQPVINDGANGRCIPRAAAPLPSDFESADRILIMLGTNDLLQGSKPGEAAAAMEQFLARLLAQGCRPILIAPPPMKRGEWVPTEDLITASRELAVQYALVAQRLSIPFVNTRHWDIPLAFDGVHFTEEGHRIFARRLLETLKGSEKL